jgi:hypothetical protein
VLGAWNFCLSLVSRLFRWMVDDPRLGSRLRMPARAFSRIPTTVGLERVSKKRSKIEGDAWLFSLLIDVEGAPSHRHIHIHNTVDLSSQVLLLEEN